MLQRFLVLCRKPIIECSDATPIITSDNIVRKSYRKRTEGGIDYHIDALILPDEMKWPTFLAIMQSESYCKNIYFQRESVVDINRRKYTIDTLREKGNVVWMGSPGIGKSCDVNHILLELLSHLGEDTWPSEVAFRSGIDMFTFTSTDVTRTEIKFSDLESFSARHLDSVLVMKLDDGENNPILSMPFILVASSKDLYSRLKTLMHARDSTFMLMSPPDVEEMCLVTEAIMELCPTSNPFKGNSKEEAVNIVRSRALKVGGIPRQLFCSEKFYKATLVHMNVASYSLSRCLDSLSAYDIPRTVQSFVALFFKEGVTDPKFPMIYKEAAPELFATFSKENNSEVMALMNSLFNFEFRYLTDYAKVLHSSVEQSFEDLQVLKRLNLDDQIFETLIRFREKNEIKSDEGNDMCYVSKNWEWHKDVGYKNLLSRNSLLPASKIPILPQCSSEIVFQGSYYVASVSKLDSSKIYRSTFYKLAFFNYFTVDHTKKRVYLYQVTSGDLRDHPLDISTVALFMSKLGMFEKPNLKYQATLLFFNDWNRKITYGSKFFDADKNIVDLKELKSKKDKIAARLQVYIIRGSFFPSSTKCTYM